MVDVDLVRAPSLATGRARALCGRLESAGVDFAVALWATTILDFFLLSSSFWDFKRWSATFRCFFCKNNVFSKAMAIRFVFLCSDLLRRRVLSPSLRGPARAVRFAAGRWGAEYVRRIFFADMLFRLRACDLRCGSTECLLC